MRTRNFFPDGVGGEFNMPLAKEAGHFQEIGLAQDDNGLAMRTVYCLSEVTAVKSDMNTTSRAGHFKVI